MITGITDSEITEFFIAADKDESGYVDFKEFIQVMIDQLINVKI